MRQFVSELIGADKRSFHNTGALDPILNADTLMFIDPFLLKQSAAPEFAGAFEKLMVRFDDVLTLLASSEVKGDVFWRKAEQLVDFAEINGICIGYSSLHPAGSGLGSLLAENLLVTAKNIHNAGVKNPRIFELVGVFQEGIGPDRISDMIAKVLIKEIISFTERVFIDLGCAFDPVRIAKTDRRVVRAPLNPYVNYPQPVLLIPRDILSDLPVAYSWTEIDYIATTNQELRDRLNDAIGDTWKKVTSSHKKQELLELMFAFPELFSSLLDNYFKKTGRPYDFERDPKGYLSWLPGTRLVVDENPIELKLERDSTPDDVLSAVRAICVQFKVLVEHNKLSDLLYDGTVPKHESAAQLVFFGIADGYCQVNGLDLTKEANAGRGPVDFKFSVGYHNRVLVEAKLSTNKRLLHGFKTQVKEYEDAERTDHSILLVIDVGGGDKRLEDLRLLYQERKNDQTRCPEVIFVDGRPKASASKY